MSMLSELDDEAIDELRQTCKKLEIPSTAEAGLSRMAERAIRACFGDAAKTEATFRAARAQLDRKRRRTLAEQEKSEAAVKRQKSDSSDSDLMHALKKYILSLPKSRVALWINMRHGVQPDMIGISEVVLQYLDDGNCSISQKATSSETVFTCKCGAVIRVQFYREHTDMHGQTKRYLTTDFSNTARHLIQQHSFARFLSKGK
jgi:hypothetical protein